MKYLIEDNVDLNFFAEAKEFVHFFACPKKRTKERARVGRSVRIDARLIGALKSCLILRSSGALERLGDSSSYPDQLATKSVFFGQFGGVAFKRGGREL